MSNSMEGTVKYLYIPRPRKTGSTKSGQSEQLCTKRFTQQGVHTAKLQSRFVHCICSSGEGATRLSCALACIVFTVAQWNSRGESSLSGSQFELKKNLEAFLSILPLFVEYFLRHSSQKNMSFPFKNSNKEEFYFKAAHFIITSVHN